VETRVISQGAQHAKWIAGYLASFLISRSVMPSAPRNFRPGRWKVSTKKVREKINELQQL